MRGPMRGPKLKPARARRGVTLMELLVVLALLGVLLGILLPVLRGAIDSARSFRCQMSLRNVAYDLHMFVDPRLDQGRTHDPCTRHGHVALETFQESLYGIDEYWRYGSGRSQVALDAADDVPLRCAAVRGDLVLRRDAPCSGGGVASWDTVSYGFNARLHRVPGGRSTSTCLNERTIDESMVPLAWDVDGREATRRGVTPVYSAPPTDGDTIYDDGRMWMPASRHGSGINVAFLDGHVESSRTPLDEPGWRWGFAQPH